MNRNHVPKFIALAGLSALAGTTSAAQAPCATSDGSGSTACGSSALAANNGVGNTAIGFDALTSN